MTSEPGLTKETYVTCEACGEENKRGSTRCARCGAELPHVDGGVVDPELQAFNAAQDALAEENRRGRLAAFLKGIAGTG